MVTLNKDGTERKKREPKAKKKDGGGDPTKGKSQSKEQLNTQRNVMRETLRQLKEKRKDDPEAFEIGSVYDLALGLELWLNDNSKVRGFSLLFGTFLRGQKWCCVCVCVCVCIALESFDDMLLRQYISRVLVND